MAEKHWIRLTDHSGEPSAWINMNAVAAVRPNGRGGLRIEAIGEQEQDPEKQGIPRWTISWMTRSRVHPGFRRARSRNP